MAGVKKWFWVTIEGYLSYILPKFGDFISTGLGSGAFKSMHGFSEYTQYMHEVDELYESDAEGTGLNSKSQVATFSRVKN